MYPNQYCKPCNDPEPCIEVPAPPDCIGEPCDEIVLDTCVRYTGPAIPCLGIETGANINEIVQIIAARLCDCCDGTPPVIDCEVSPWSPWSECVDGVQTRTRTVIQSPQNGGAECPELEETRECCLEPIDCIVSEWSEWSECVDGVQTRTRTVLVEESCGGECFPLEETRECCLPVDCVVSEWGAWSECVDGFRTRTRTVVTAASCGGTACPSLTETQACDMPCVPLTEIEVLSDNCETLQVSFTDDGNATVLYAELFNSLLPTSVSTKVWTPLGSAATYSHTFTGLTAGSYYVKIYKDAGTVKCDTFATLSVVVSGCPVNCVLSDWSEWSVCDEGTQTRTRTVITPASNGGTPCGPLTETRSCAVDCVVSDWSEWSECIEGTRTRTRTVITPALNGGTPCPVLTETEACPVDCVVSEWSAWSDCNPETYTRTRTRTVLVPAQNGGIPCPVLTETEACTIPKACISYTAATSEASAQQVEYIDCMGVNQTVMIGGVGGFDATTFCAQENTVIAPGGVQVVQNGPCGEPKTVNVLSGFASMQPCIGGTIDDYMGASITLDTNVTVDTTFQLQVEYVNRGQQCISSTPKMQTSLSIFVPAGQSYGDLDACSGGGYYPEGINICSSIVTGHDNTVDNIIL